MLKTVFTLFTFLPAWLSTCAVRITVKECPVTETAWKTRSQNYECKADEKYHCIEDEERTLMEICMIPCIINPYSDDGCPWAYHDTQRGSFLGIGHHPCKGIGCPHKNDSVYWTNQLYKYPSCLHHTVMSTISPLNVTEMVTSNGIRETDEIFTTKEAIPIVLVIVVPVSLVAVFIIMIMRGIWCKNKSNEFTSSFGEEGKPMIPDHLNSTVTTELNQNQENTKISNFGNHDRRPPEISQD